MLYRMLLIAFLSDQECHFNKLPRPHTLFWRVHSRIKLDSLDRQRCLRALQDYIQGRVLYWRARLRRLQRLSRTDSRCTICRYHR